MTNCSPASSRSRSCARISGGAPARRGKGDGRIREKILAALPFRLTGSQDAALAEIEADLGRPRAHAPPPPGRCRLRQDGRRPPCRRHRHRSRRPGGDHGADRAPRPPARPHHRSRSPRRPASAWPCSPAARRAASATRSSPASPTASIDLLLGTHALFQAGVDFRDLALVVVDEQHRFGVHQRLALTAKGGATDVLVMTATPIPRTLVAHLLRRHGRLAADREAGRPPADRDPRHPARAARRGGRAHPRRDRRTAPRPIGSARWSRNPSCSTSPRPRSASPRSTAALGPIVGLVHGRMKPAERDRDDGRASSPARSASSSPPP